MNEFILHGGTLSLKLVHKFSMKNTSSFLKILKKKKKNQKSTIYKNPNGNKTKQLFSSKF